MLLAAPRKICRAGTRHQIAIEPAAAAYSPFRDFVHCRFAVLSAHLASHMVLRVMLHGIWKSSPTSGAIARNQKKGPAMQLGPTLVATLAVRYFFFL
jgi:hypothetical protein